MQQSSALALTPALLERLQIGDEVVDLFGGQNEFRHLLRTLVAHENPFSERFRQSFDIVFFVQRAQWWRGGVRTVAGRGDRMTGAAIPFNEGATRDCVAWLRMGRGKTG